LIETSRPQSGQGARFGLLGVGLADDGRVAAMTATTISGKPIAPKQSKISNNSQ
jgi:hypothetical protein